MSGWATLTVDTTDEVAAERLQKAGRDTDAIRSAYVDDTSYTAIVSGWDGDTIAREFLKTHTSLWDRAVVMMCNDTSDSGEGTVYESDNGDLSTLDTAHGVEGARGHDARSELERYVDTNICMR